MVNNIQVPATVEGVSTLKDGGLSVRLHTQELQPAEKTVVLEKQGQFGWFLFAEQAFDEDELELEAIRKDIGGKSHSQRLRSVLYVRYKSLNRPDISFEQYYSRRMEQFIDHEKGLIDG